MSNTSPPQRLSRVESRARTRQNLLEAAERVFAERGFKNATLDQVAEAAGLTKGAVYSNFSSKDELFIALFEARSQRDGQHWLEAFQNTPGDRFERVMDAAARAMHAERDWVRLELEFYLYALDNDAAREKLLKHQQRIAQGIAGVFEAHLQTHAKRQINTLASALPWVSLGLAMRSHLGEDASGTALRYVFKTLLRH